ncbi:MAG: TlpA disulfide reductase family protein [Hydrogenobacter sp.]|uniref:TlpA disulfide reductase family protein n=1 Tax=Hydrogenobacter thermophilus TaxID=940 RepID=UPI0030FB0100
MRKISYLLALLLLGGLLFFAFVHKKEDEEGYSVSPSSAQSFPDFTFTGLDGKVYRLSDFKGKIVLLNFWASWCPPCREEMPLFEKVYEDCKKYGFVILAVSMDTNSSLRDNYLKELKPSFLILEGNDDIKLVGLPTSYLIDRNGKVYKVKLGVYREVKEDIEKLLGPNERC